MRFVEIMLRFGETKVAKKEYGTKKTTKTQGVNVYNIVVSKLIKKNKNNWKTLIGYLD